MPAPRRFAFFAVLALAACSSTPPQGTNASAPIECQGGNACTCDQNCSTACTSGNCYLQCNASQCDFACGDGNCDVYVPAGASTSVGCAAGGCSVSSDGPGNNVVICPGGGCGMSCNGSTSCAIQQCTHDCVVRCENVPDGGCQNSCDGGGCLTIVE